MQHLHMDLTKVHIHDANTLRNVVRKISSFFDLQVQQVQVMEHGNHGYSLMAWFQDAAGHLTIHSSSGNDDDDSVVVLFDLICQTTSTNKELQDATNIVALALGGFVETFSVVSRGTSSSSKPTNEPLDIISVHSHHKEKLLDMQSASGNVQVWDVGDAASSSALPDRRLYVDGQLRMSLSDQVPYFESFVHPAFVGSSVPPQRVLILGGATNGGILCEALKWDSVEQVVVDESDDSLFEANRLFSAFHSCANFGTTDCYDDPRVIRQTQDLRRWLAINFGTNACKKKRDKKKNALFDLVLVDWLYVEALFDDEEEFVESITCALSKFGVLAVSFGEAPSAGYAHSHQKHEQDESFKDYAETLELIQDVSSYFWQKRVYDVSLETMGTMWAFGTFMIPNAGSDTLRNDVELTNGVYNGLTNGGINDFDGRPARVNLKLRRGLKDGVLLAHYDGVVQHGFRFPLAGWKEVYCADFRNAKVCSLEKIFTKDYEDELFEYHLDEAGGVNSGIVAKRDIKKGTVTG